MGRAFRMIIQMAAHLQLAIRYARASRGDPSRRINEKAETAESELPFEEMEIHSRRKIQYGSEDRRRIHSGFTN